MLSTKWWSSSLHLSVLISGWVQCWLWTDMCLFSMEAVMVIGIWNMMLLGNLYCHTEWWIVHWSLYIPWNMHMIRWADLLWLCYLFPLIHWIYLPIFYWWLTWHWGSHMISPVPMKWTFTREKNTKCNWMHKSLNVLYAVVWKPNNYDDDKMIMIKVNKMKIIMIRMIRIIMMIKITLVMRMTIMMTIINVGLRLIWVSYFIHADACFYLFYHEISYKIADFQKKILIVVIWP